MKKEEKERLRKKTVAQLLSLLEKKQKELVEAKIKLAQAQLKNVHLPRRLRHEIAIIKTILGEKQKKGNNGKKKTN